MKEDVKKVLLMPIEVTTGTNEIFTYNNKIFSSQTYSLNIDPDMSDIAVQFYEILYGREILEINDSKETQFVNQNYAGDTMNTGIYEKGSRFKNKLDSKFRHCLANFWIIPLDHGRKREKPQRDYVDKYLKYVEEAINKDEIYFNDFGQIQEFLGVHCLSESIKSVTIEDQIRCIEERANLIVKSDKFEELQKLFISNNLL
ncbi:hypothetical protein ACN9KL_01670 [Vagococcus fluvialis]|uniref:hypothetical protein n=1 Tax=Vagococcus fluvialis TaxID=2738 RepID=UPI003B212681